MWERLTLCGNFKLAFSNTCMFYLSANPVPAVQQPVRMLIKTQLPTRGSTSWIAVPSPLPAWCSPQTAHSWQTSLICDLLQQMVVPGHRPPVWTPPPSPEQSKGLEKTGFTLNCIPPNTVCLDQLGVEGACSFPAPGRASFHQMNGICECVCGFGF